MSEYNATQGDLEISHFFQTNNETINFLNICACFFADNQCLLKSGDLGTTRYEAHFRY